MTISDPVEINPAERLPLPLRRLVDIGTEPGDDPELRLRKRMLVMVTVISTTAIVLAVAATLAVGDPRSALPPALYLTGSLLGLAHLATSKRVEVLLYSQLTMFLLLPVLMQWLLGGFVGSAVAVLYALQAAIVAMMLVPPRQARWWFVGFVAAVVLCGLMDSWLVETVRSPDVPRALFFALTVTVVGLLAWLPLTFFVGSRRRLVTELDDKNVQLARQRQRADSLLLNILPSEIATRLKDGERPIADRCPQVAVLFADIVDFSRTSERMNPDEVIAELNTIFTRFDRLASTHQLEKVKTIGDAYMVVAGAPEPRPDPAGRVTRMARAMRAASAELTFGGQPLTIRIGMDVGTVVAGVIGENRFGWDLYGDAVNTAARMQSHGVPGQIQVTDRLRAMLPSDVPTVERPPMEIKGKGVMTTYLIYPE
jgi:adenylate cyclase